jgi:23S rRNA (guanosine2251-2'-O)-methyltransferase
MDKILNKKNSSTTNILIYGRHPVISALQNPKRKCKALFTTHSIWRELQQKLPDIDIKVNICEAHQLDRMLSFGVNHQNIILESAPLSSISIEEIISEAAQKPTSCIVILDQVTDPHNVGAIMRSAAAFSADAIILTENNSPKENNTIAKCSAGAVENLPMSYVTNLSNCIKTLKKAGYWIVGLDGHSKQILSSTIFSDKIAIILGSEDQGMRKLTKENCDYLVKISISSNLESLNVSNAASIALYEYSRYITSTK